MTTPTSITLRLPASLIRVWTPRSLVEQAARAVLETPGVEALREDLFAVLPIPGDPGEVDVAAGCGERLLRTLGPAAAAGVRVVVLPGLVTVSESLRVEADGLLRDLDHRPPQAPGGEVYLTGHAARRIEGLCRVEPCGRYEGPSGSLVPLLVIRGLRDHPRPWTNPQLLGREPPYVARPAVEEELLHHRGTPAARMVGPLGCGKTRVAWQTLGDPQRDETQVGRQTPRATGWITGGSPRSGYPNLVAQLLRRLLTLHQNHAGGDPAASLGALHLEDHRGWLLDDPLFGDRPKPTELTETVLEAMAVVVQTTGAPVRLVFDDLQMATREELELLAEVFGEPAVARDFRALFIGRPSTRWPEGLESLPKINVAPMTEEEAETLATPLLKGLKMPPEVRQRLLRAAAGYPLALEEGLARMIQRKDLRSVYGNFFFSGDRTADYEPSGRLIQYLEAEAGGPDPRTALRLLALADGPVPARELAAAAALFGAELPPRWEAPFLTSGWLRPADSPWGPGIEIACPAYRRGLERTVAPDSILPARRALGELLGHASDKPQARWRAYNLMSGSSQAISPILELAKGAPDDVPAEEIFAGLQLELDAHRQRRGDPAQELQLLWLLLPLARRTGRLPEVREEFPRALALAADDPQRLLAFASLQADLATEEGRFQEGEAALREALNLVLKADPGRQALVLMQLGQLMLRQERFAEARSLFDQLVESLEQRKRDEGPDPGLEGWIATCHFHRGNIALRRGRLDEALDLHQRALKTRRHLDHRRQMGISLSALGAVFLNRGDYPQALAHCREAEALLTSHGKDADLSYALLGIGRTLRRLGDFTAASTPLLQALRLRETSPDVVGEAMARVAVAANELSLGHPARALAEARKAHFRLSLIPEVGFLGHVERTLGRAHLAQRRMDPARAHLETALEIHQRHEDATAVTEDQGWLLELALQTHHGEEIRRLCRALLDPDETDRTGRPEPQERPAILQLRLFRGLEWLQIAGAPQGDPLEALRSAYSAMMRRASLLQPEQCHHFLSHIPENAAILAAATEHRLEAPNPAQEPT